MHVCEFDEKICRLHCRISKRLSIIPQEKNENLQFDMLFYSRPHIYLTSYKIEIVFDRNIIYLTELQKFSFIHSIIYDHRNCTNVITDYFAISVISLRDFCGPCMHACIMLVKRNVEIVTESAKLQCIWCKIAVQSSKWLYRCYKRKWQNNGYDIYRFHWFT